jgi:hypothetical protein
VLLQSAKMKRAKSVLSILFRKAEKSWFASERMDAGREKLRRHPEELLAGPERDVLNSRESTEDIVQS